MVLSVVKTSVGISPLRWCLLTANAGYGAGDNTVSVRLNRGDGTNTGVLSNDSTVEVGDLPRPLTVGEFDLDFTTPNGSTGQVRVRLNGGATLAIAPPLSS
jgi:hypothetical protein